MKAELWWVGKTKSGDIRNLMNFYLKRISHLGSLHTVEWPDAKKKVPELARAEVSDKMLKKISTADHVVLLDAGGKVFSSKEFSHYLESAVRFSKRRLVFIIGSAYGFSSDLRQRADFLLSLSAMTFPHDLVRIIFLEQYYRALTIKKNLPYHHE